VARSSAQNILMSTDIPGVFRSRAGVLCNEKGVSLSFTELKSKDDARWVEAVGAVPTTPAELLKATAMDPRMPLDTRLSAARQAAPYYDMRMPLRIDGSMTAKSGIDMAKLAAMPRVKRETLLELLKAAGVEL
jgi:hypothetical protein